MKKSPEINRTQNHKCHQTAWMRSVSRALELISKRLHSVERENFFLRIFFALTTVGILAIASLNLYQFFFVSNQNPSRLSSNESSESVSSLDSIPPSIDVNSLEFNDQLTKSAWRALNERNYSIALNKSQHCIDLFADRAIEEQALLTESKIPLPSMGKSEQMQKEEIEAILSRGLVNNVAACYYIQGLALQKLDRLDEAQGAFQKVTRFVHARIYDPVVKIFWSPEESAMDMIHEIDIQFANKKESILSASETVTSS